MYARRELEIPVRRNPNYNSWRLTHILAMKAVDDDEQNKGYMWEIDYAEGLDIREVLHEDEVGCIEKSISNLIFDAKKKQRCIDRPTKVRLGIMRYLYIAIDCSFSMAGRQMLPSRLVVTLKALDKFLEKFSEQNPISQVGIIVCREKRADLLAPLTGNIRTVKEALATITGSGCQGEFSLYSSLLLAANCLQSYPGHASREVLLVLSSLSTCDPEDVFGTFELLKRYNVRCSVISLSAEVFVFRKLCCATSGLYGVALDASHLEILLNEHTNPPVSSRKAESCVVRMGFPLHETIAKPSFCLCHQTETRTPFGRGFFCPQCGSRYCTLPVECRVCKLLLISAPQLARSLQNLFPLPAFREVVMSGKNCFGCGCFLNEKSFECKKCRNVYCIDCDVLLHESVQICPGCPASDIY